MRMDVCRAPVLTLLVLSVGCGRNMSTTEPSPTSSVVNTPAANVAVRVEGRVVDDERNQPISAAAVRAVQVGADGGYWNLDQPLASAATDGNGAFLLTARVSPRWKELLLDVSREGYEPTRIYVSPTAATAAELRLYQRLTIRRGESVQMSVDLGSYVCGFESHRCRRVFVESGEAMDLEVMHADGPGKAGLVVGPEINHPISVVDYQPRATMSGGEVWIYVGQGGSVTLTASRR